MIAKRQSIENIDPPPKSKRRSVANKKSCREDSDDEESATKKATPRSPFGNLGNLTKTTLTTDPFASAHVNIRQFFFLIGDFKNSF